MERRLMRMLAILSIAFAVATIALWIDSYWRSRCVKWVHDTPTNGGMIRINPTVFILRGGFTLSFTFDHATTVESVNSLMDYYHWHPILEMWSETTEAIDAESRYLFEEWPRSYLFMPATRSTLGIQFSGRRGVYQGNHYWNAHAAIPFWFPFESLRSIPAVVRMA